MGEPVELTLGDGSTVKGADLDNAFENLAKMKAEAAEQSCHEQAATFTQGPRNGNGYYKRTRAKRRKRVEDLRADLADPPPSNI